MTVNRRTFLALVAATPIAAVVAPFRPTPSPVQMQGFVNMPVALSDPVTGIAIRFVRQFELHRDGLPTRLDCWVAPTLWRDPDTTGGA